MNLNIRKTKDLCKVMAIALISTACTMRGEAAEPVWPPKSYIMTYKVQTGDQNFVKKIAKSPPDLLHLADWNAPIPYDLTCTEMLYEPLSEALWMANFEKTKAWVQQLHEAGAKWIIPYVCNFTQGGDHEERTGMWRIYDHWDEYGYPQLGFGPKPPEDPIEWAMRRPNGNLKLYYPFDQYRRPPYAKPGTAGVNRYAMCPSNPYWRKWLNSITRWIARAGFDGVFVDNGVMHCFCKHCEAGFKKYIQARYDNADLKQQLGIDNFADVKMQRSGPLLAEVYRYWAVSESEHYAAIKQGGDQVRPGFIVIPNGLDRGVGRPASGGDVHIWSQSVDGFMAEGNVTPGMVDSLPIGAGVEIRKFEDNILPYKVVAGLPGRKQCVGTPYHTNYDDYRQVGLAMAEAAAFGGQVVPTSIKAPWDKWRKFLNDHHALYEQVRPIAPVLLLLSFNDLRAANPAALAETDAIRKALQSMNIPYILRTVEAVPEIKLNQFEVVIAPNVTCLGDAEGASLRRYVKAGGNLITSGAVGSRYWAGAKRSKSLLAEVLPQATEGLAQRQVGSGQCIWSSWPLAGPEGPVIASALLRATGRCMAYLEPEQTGIVYLDTWQRDDGARLVHLVNYHTEPTAGLRVLLPWTASKENVKVILHTPDQPQMLLTPELKADGIVVKLNKLDQYAVLEVSGFGTSGKGTGSITQFLPQTQEQVRAWATLASQKAEQTGSAPPRRRSLSQSPPRQALRRTVN